MKEIKHPSVIPVYGIGAFWLLYALIFPMNRIYHFLICAALSVGVYFLLRHFFPGTVEYVEEPVSTGNVDLDELIATGKKSVAEIRTINLRIPDPEITKKLDRIESVTELIFKKAAENQTNIRQVRRFMDYYLPTTISLLNRYIELRDNGISTESSVAAQEKIIGMLDTVVVAFENELNSLYENDLVDITADIEVMKKMMASEGLTEKKDF